MIDSFNSSLDAYHRKLQLDFYFTHEEDTRHDNTIPHPPSQWLPPRAPWTNTIATYINTVRATAHQLIRQARQFYNTDAATIMRVLQSLRQNPDLIIKPADKNLGLVLMSPSGYELMCMEHLDDVTTYREIDSAHFNFRLTYARLRQILTDTNNLYREGRQQQRQLSKLALALLQLEDSKLLRIAPFYCLPKVHKSPSPPYPGRPIVSAPSTATYHTSVYLNRLLLPLLRRHPTICFSSRSTVCDTLDFHDPAATVMVTADVCSLYPSIPITTGIQAVTAFLLEDNTLAPPQQQLIIHLLRWVLLNNYCIFKGRIFLQIKGTAMGTPVAVAYANITLFMIERPLLIDCRFYRRYIDDVFALFTSTIAAWIYYHGFNDAVPGILLDTPTIGPSGIFLDLSLTLSQGRVQSTLYQKPANLYCYIPPMSDHRRNVFPSFIREELKRYQLNCSNPLDYYRFAQLFETRLRRRGYPSEMIALARSCIPTRSTLTHALTHPPVPNPNPNPTPSRPTIVLCLPHLHPTPRWQELLRIPTALTDTLAYRVAYGTSKVLVGHRNAPNTAHIIMSSLYPPPHNNTHP